MVQIRHQPLPSHARFLAPVVLVFALALPVVAAVPVPARAPALAPDFAFVHDLVVAVAAVVAAVSGPAAAVHAVKHAFAQAVLDRASKRAPELALALDLGLELARGFGCGPDRVHAFARGSALVLEQDSGLTPTLAREFGRALVREPALGPTRARNLCVTRSAQAPVVVHAVAHAVLHAAAREDESSAEDHAAADDAAPAHDAFDPASGRDFDCGLATHRAPIQPFQPSAKN